MKDYVLKDVMTAEGSKYDLCVRSMIESNIKARSSLFVMGKKKEELNRWKDLLQRYNDGTETLADVLVVYEGIKQVAQGMSGSGSGPAELPVYMDTVLTLGKVSELVLKEAESTGEGEKANTEG